MFVSDIIAADSLPGFFEFLARWQAFVAGLADACAAAGAGAVDVIGAAAFWAAAAAGAALTGAAATSSP